MIIDLEEAYTAANVLLVVIENTFNSEGIVLPARRYITVGGLGTVAYDCEQLTISWERTYSGFPGRPNQEIARCETVRTGVFIVELVRPIPVSNNPDIPPEPFLIQESGEKLMKDSVLLYNSGLTAALTHNEIARGGLASVAVGAPSGGYQSLVMTVEMPI